MPQTQVPAVRVQAGDTFPDPSTNTRYPGDVFVLGSVPLVVAPTDPNLEGVNTLVSEGIYDLPKTSDVFTYGDAVYWNASGDPVSGTAGTGAADNATGNLAGLCIANAASGDYYVRTKLTAAKRTATIAGSVTADDITGSDSSLAITGQAANAGGALVITGGVGALTGGGAITMITGAANGNNANGGAMIIDGGAAHGTGTAGTITIGTNASATIFGKMPRVPFNIVNAAGGNIATAAALTAGWALIAGSDNAKGVQLPSCANGAQMVVINKVTDKTLLVYPPTGKEINGAGANNAIVMAANTIDVFASEGTNAWYGFTAAVDLS